MTGGQVRRRSAVQVAAGLMVSAMVTVLAGGCGGESGNDLQPSLSNPSARSEAETAPKESSGTPSGSRTDAENTPRPPERRVRTLPNGTVYYPPAQPKTTRIRASDRCDTARIQHGEGLVTETVPPRPGLQARLANRVVTISYDTGNPPRRCRPQALSLTVDSIGDPNPPLSRTFRVRTPTRRTLTVRLPEYFRSSPDVVRLTAGMPNGRISQTSQVRVQR